MAKTQVIRSFKRRKKTPAELRRARVEAYQNLKDRYADEKEPMKKKVLKLKMELAKTKLMSNTESNKDYLVKLLKRKYNSDITVELAGSIVDEIYEKISSTEKPLIRIIGQVIEKYGLNDKVLSMTDELDLFNKAKSDLEKNKLMSSKVTNKYVIECNDVEGSLLKVIESIKERGNTGHSFSILIDRESDNPIEIYWDGDGGDSISEVIQEEIKAMSKLFTDYEDGLANYIAGLNSKTILSVDADWIKPNELMLYVKGDITMDDILPLVQLMEDDFETIETKFSKKQSGMIIHAIGLKKKTFSISDTDEQGLALLMAKSQASPVLTWAMMRGDDFTHIKDHASDITSEYNSLTKSHIDVNALSDLISEIEKMKFNGSTLFSDMCPEDGCVQMKDNGKWGIISNKTGEFWDADYESKESAEDGLKAYHASKNFSDLEGADPQWMSIYSEIAGTLVNLRLAHHGTKDSPLHEAYGEAYEDFNSVTDALIEQYLGSTGEFPIVSSYMNNREYVAPNFGPELAKEIILLGKKVKAFASSKGINSVENLSDEVSGIGNKLLYKLRLSGEVRTYSTNGSTIKFKRKSYSADDKLNDSQSERTVGDLINSLNSKIAEEKDDQRVGTLKMFLGSFKHIADSYL